MTLNELELFCLQLQSTITEQQNQIEALNERINELEQSNEVLANSAVSAINKLKDIGYLQNLLDVKATSLTKNDILQYGSDGRWHNIQPALVLNNGNSGSGSIVIGSTLSELTDVHLANLNDGEVLTYSATDGKWINKEPSIIL